ncbi:MAG: polysaccharide pyruvyl transferase family protein [Methylotenera sp.]|nr:polysaccharide pyruvyl transferase family protein [Methylotenera sp.]
MQTTFQANANSTLSSEDIWGGRQLISELQAKARAVLDPLIPASASVALLDYPNYSNVGDSLIWLGEMAYLRLRKIQPTYVCDFKNYSTGNLLHSLGNIPVILLQGGGNFGSLWKTIHDFRLQILKYFKGIPVIQLPQSIHFNDDEVLEETRQAIRQHGNFTLVVRDQPSYDFATSQFDCKVLLCPDMAFFIGPISSNKQPEFDRFILSRTDHEKSNNWVDDLPRLGTGISIDQNDWLDQQTTEKVLNRIQRHTSGFRPMVDPNNTALLLLWNALANARLVRGKTLLKRGRVVISDRLHVHILSILLNKPHVLIDNNYGKLGNFHQAWTTHYRGVKFVCDLEAALDAASDFDAQMHRSNSMVSA